MSQNNVARTIYRDRFGLIVTAFSDEQNYKVFIEKVRKESDQYFLQTLKFQNGPVSVVGFNGFQNEHILAILIDRIKQQEKNCSSIQNKIVLEHLQESLHALELRTEDRISRNVEGMYVS